MEPIQSNKIYPIGIQNFEKMRKGGYFYVASPSKSSFFPWK